MYGTCSWKIFSWTMFFKSHKSLFELEILMSCLDQNYLQLHRKTSAKNCCFPIWKKSLKHETESLLPLKKIRWLTPVTSWNYYWIILTNKWYLHKGHGFSQMKCFGDENYLEIVNISWMSYFALPIGVSLSL